MLALRTHHFIMLFLLPQKRLFGFEFGCVNQLLPGSLSLPYDGCGLLAESEPPPHQTNVINDGS